MKPPEGKKWFGFYSALAAPRWGTNVYRTADGREVEVTCVSNTAEWGDKEYKWADKVALGELTEYVRRGIIGYEESWDVKI